VARVKERILLMEAEVQACNKFMSPLAQHDPYFRNYANEDELNSVLEKLKKDSQGREG